MTGRFERILVAMSPGALEPDSLRTAGRLAEASGAQVTMLDVVEPVPRRRRLRLRRRGSEVDTEIAYERSERLHRLAAEIRPGHVTDVEVVVGRPSAEVIDHVMSRRIDLVIVGGGDPAPSDTAGLPNGVTQLLRKCPVPVLVLRPIRAGGPRVLALVDPDPDDQVREGLNGRVLDVAAALAGDVSGELHVGHALERSVDAGSPPPTDPPGEGRRAGRVDALLERHGVASSEVHVVAGHPGEALPSLAEQLGADLIVIGTVARTGLSGVIIGNSAETMLQSVHCSVLAIKPDDAVSTLGTGTQVA